jgi:hypothetical protein
VAIARPPAHAPVLFRTRPARLGRAVVTLPAFAAATATAAAAPSALIDARARVTFDAREDRIVVAFFLWEHVGARHGGARRTRRCGDCGRFELRARLGRSCGLWFILVRHM